MQHDSVAYTSVLGARLAGQLAFFAGQKANPYDVKDPLHHEWQRGYREVSR